VLIETFRPGVIDDWGIGYEQLCQEVSSNRMLIKIK
jgi:crotonobetainyl-CoA:carnitine CoA-transferase CaiB-like acyl-CoA transferase